MSLYSVHILAIWLTLGLSDSGQVAQNTAKRSCDERGGLYAMSLCADSSYRRVRAEVEQEVQRLLPRYSAENRRRLRQAERSWEEYRSAECFFEASKFTGNGRFAFEQITCMERVSRGRLAELRTVAAGLP